MHERLEVGGVEVLVEGSGPETLLLLHGWPDTRRLWDGTVDALRDSFRCARFTWPGFDAGSGRVQPTLDEVVDLMLQVVERLCPAGRVTLVLHDWGCVFGYQFALRHPQRVARIVGVDIGDTQELPRALGPQELIGIGSYQLWLASAWRIGGVVGDAMTRSVANWARAPEAAQARWTMNWPYDLAWFGGQDALSRHSLPFRPACPMLFVYGKRKPFRFHSGAWAEELGRRPGCRVEAFDTGHWVMSEAPERFHRVLREWLLHAPGS